MDDCSTGGAFGIELASQNGPIDWTYAWEWDAPTDVTVAGMTVWRRVRADRFRYDLLADSVVVDSGTWFDDFQPRTIEGLNASRVVLRAVCDDGDRLCFRPERPPPLPEESIRFRRIEMQLRDTLAPKAPSPASGELVQPGVVSGTASIATTFSDRGGGVRSAALLVDGLQREEVSVVGPGCSLPYLTPVPCPLSGMVEIRVDTASLTDGGHNIELRLADVAGNTTSVGPFRVVVQNGPVAGDAVYGSAVERPGRLGVVRSKVRARYGQTGTIDGRLLDTSGAPIAGGAVEVAVRDTGRSSNFVLAAPVVTDSAGRFSVRLPKGPSRIVRLRYGVSEVIAQIVTAAPVRLKPTPTSTRNGRIVRFGGRVLGTTASGPLVELQAWADRKWIPFKTARLVKGRFTARYRFTNTTSTTRYQFRAVVRAHPDLPYAAGRSAVVKVLVRP